MKNWIRANVELTEWINGHLPEAKKLLNAADPERNRQGAACRGHRRSFQPHGGNLRSDSQLAADLGTIGIRRRFPWPADAGLSRLYDLSSLNQVLAEKKKKAIQ